MRARGARRTGMTDAGWWALAGAASVTAVFSGFAEHKRGRRQNLDRPGWVPWNLFQVLSGIAAVIAAVLALKS